MKKHIKEIIEYAHSKNIKVVIDKADGQMRVFQEKEIVENVENWRRWW